MLPESGAANHSGNSVTTLTCSIVPHIIDRHQLVAPAFDGRPRGDALEPEQPFPVIGPAAGQNEGTRQNLAVLVHHVHSRLGDEDAPRILHQGEHRHLPLLPVRLAQPPDYAGRLPSTPAFLRSERTVSVGIAPFASQADRKSTRLNSSHLGISYAVFCLKKK